MRCCRWRIGRRSSINEDIVDGAEVLDPRNAVIVDERPEMRTAFLSSKALKPPS